MKRALSLLAAALAALFLASCARDAQVSAPQDQAGLLSGTWILTSRIEEGKEVPVAERFMRLVLREDGAYRAEYRGDATQKWIVAGRGVFSFVPPVVQFFWDSGDVTSFLVLERDSNRLHLHHGVSLAPLKEQSPDEIYRRDASGTPGPRKPS